MIKTLKKNWLVLLVVVFCYWAIKPFLSQGFFPMHDDTQVARIGQMFTALSQGQFPVRWVGDLGYGLGYPIFNFYAPLAYYVGAFLALFTSSFLLATKLAFALSLIVGAITAFFLGKELWGKWGGFLTAVFYTFAPYHAVDLYVRGALSELWALAFAPLIYWGILKMAKAKKVSLISVAIFIFGLTGVILSHNLSALINLPFIALVCLMILVFGKNRFVFLKNLSLGTVFSLGLSCFYWLPALVEMGETKIFGQVGGGADFQDHFVFLDQLWASPWGFGGSALGRLDGMSFMVGKIHLLLIVLVLFIFLTRIVLGKTKSLLVGGLVSGGFILSLFFTLSISTFVWQSISPMAFIQYPWRFLGPAILFGSVLAGAFPFLLIKQKNVRIPLVLFLSIVLVIFSLKYFQVQTLVNKTDDDYLNQEAIKWQISKVSDEYLPKDFPVPQKQEEVAWDKIVVLSGEAKIKERENLFLRQEFLIKTEGRSEVLVNTAFFPGWQAKLDEQIIVPEIYQGKMKFVLLQGEHWLKLEFKDTLIRRIANYISLASLLAFLGFVFVRKKKSA